MGCPLTAPPAVACGTTPCGDDRRPRAALPGDPTCDVAIVGAGFTGLWTAYYLSRPTRRCGVVVLEAGDGRVRCLRTQRRLVLGAVPGVAATPSPLGRARRRRWRMQRAMRDDRRRGRRASRPRRASTATSPRAGRSRSPGRRRSWRARRAEVDAARAWGWPTTTLRLLAPREARALRRRDRRARRDVHPALRGDPAGPARARARPRGRAARRDDPRAHRGDRRSGPAGCAPTHGAVRARRGRAGDRGVHARAARPARGPSRPSTR